MLSKEGSDSDDTGYLPQNDTMAYLNLALNMLWVKHHAADSTCPRLFIRWPDFIQQCMTAATDAG